MRKLIITLSSIAVLATAAAAPAAAPNAAGAAVVNQIVASEATVQPVSGGKALPADQTKQCRHLPSSYSRLPQRVCLTKQQWAKLDEESR
ncbi:MAG TPA: hypothetical protein VIV07_00325 [Sphingomicrobium sp.]